MALGICCPYHATPSIRYSWQEEYSNLRICKIFVAQESQKEKLELIKK
jgi:hypothetical protein